MKILPNLTSNISTLKVVDVGENDPKTRLHIE